MFVNNEIGVIQDIPAIGAICREQGILFHVDAAQATGKVEIDLKKLPVDLMSLASHKTYGPKGIGALYVRRKPRVRLEAQMHGGGHERGMRSGTLPTHQIVGMGEAFRIAREEMGTEDRAHPHAAAAPARRPEGHRAGVHQRQPGTPRAAQPEHELQLRRGRVADHGHQGHGGVVGLGLHLGQPGAELRAARAGPQRRAGAQQPAHDHRPLHDRGRDRLRRSTTIRQNVCPSCASCPRCGRCTRTASTSAPSSGRPTERHGTQEYNGLQRKVVDHYENPRNVGSFDKGDDTRGHRHGRRAGLRRRDEAADQGQPGHRRDRGRASRPTAAARPSRRARSSPSGSRARRWTRRCRSRTRRSPRSWRCRR